MIDNLNKSGRKMHPDNTVIQVGDTLIGNGNLTIIGGPCSVESEEQIVEIAKAIKKSGGNILRGGAFKPRTSPYDFQGKRADGLKLLSLAKKETNLPIVSEIVALNHIDLFDDVDILQVGARNMQNFELLKELGKSKKPILLKRGFANTLKELLYSAEYIMSNGNENVILCERGIRTFEDWTRNTLDLSAVPLLKNLSHLPVVVDPSHATGISSLVEPMSLAAVSAGADGLMIEVHNCPENALSDGAQSITPDKFKEIVEKSKKIKKVL
ncbi:3-deoxy-7-phosphoheptulonate synthase [Peptostreptococcus russellii]|uniref:3-deoxy-7-phosphoheptulonate synthase n=1 Tax=Peptostreptococcus russellii TaxID=215200 RepID=UPI0026F26B30|nr:3-deoxy-7-phosphoheptulonate synthase [Peptostreptococcus russellii]